MKITSRFSRSCQTHQIALRVQQSDDGGGGRERCDQVVRGHFHTILEAFQLAGRSQRHGGDFRQQLPERNQPPGERFSRRLEYVGQRRRLLDYLKSKDADRYAEVIKRLGIRK